VLRAGLSLDRQPALGIEREFGHPGALDACRSAAGALEDAQERAPGVEEDSLLLGGLRLPRVTWHPIARFDAGQLDLRPQPDRAAGNVDGDVAAAQDEHTRSEGFAFGRRGVSVAALIQAEAHVAQEVRVDQYARQVGARKRQADAFVRADRHQHRLEAFVENAVQIVDARVQAEFDPQVEDVGHLALDDLRRQAVFGHADPQHASGHRQGFEDRHRITLARQVLRRRQPAGSGADDGDPPGLGSLNRRAGRARFGIDAVGDEALEGADVDRFVDQPAVAGVFAAVVADPAADPGEGVVFLDDPQRVGVTPFADQGDVALGALPGGAGVAAGRDAQFLDGVGVGDGLRVKLVRRSPRGQPLVERIGDDDGTDRGAVAAADA
jgi:hypothetical protein